MARLTSRISPDTAPLVSLVEVDEVADVGAARREDDPWKAQIIHEEHGADRKVADRNVSAASWGGA